MQPALIRMCFSSIIRRSSGFVNNGATCTQSVALIRAREESHGPAYSFHCGAEQCEEDICDCDYLVGHWQEFLLTVPLVIFFFLLDLNLYSLIHKRLF